MLKIGDTIVEKVIVKKGNEETNLTELYCDGKLVFSSKNFLHLSIENNKVASASFSFSPTERQDFVVYTMYTNWKNAENWDNGAHTGISIYARMSRINTNMDSASLKEALSNLVFNTNGIVVIAEKPSTANYPEYKPSLSVSFNQFKIKGNAYIWECFKSECSPIYIRDLLYPIEAYVNVHYNPEFLHWTWNFRGDVYLNGRTLVSYNYGRSGDDNTVELVGLKDKLQDNEKGIIRDASKCNSSTIALDISKDSHIALEYGYTMDDYASTNIVLNRFKKVSIL